MKRYKIGYTQGVYDMFHIGHLNLLNKAKQYCDYLIVGVNSDELVEKYKNKIPVICEENRRLIVQNIKSVDEAIIATTLDKYDMLKEIKFDAIFIGDDWKGHARWNETEKILKKYSVDVVYIPYTQDVSSTLLRTQYSKSVVGE